MLLDRMKRKGDVRLFTYLETLIYFLLIAAVAAGIGAALILIVVALAVNINVLRWIPLVLFAVVAAAAAVVYVDAF